MKSWAFGIFDKMINCYCEASPENKLIFLLTEAAAAVLSF